MNSTDNKMPRKRGTAQSEPRSTDCPGCVSRVGGYFPTGPTSRPRGTTRRRGPGFRGLLRVTNGLFVCLHEYLCCRVKESLFKDPTSSNIVKIIKLGRSGYRIRFFTGLKT